MTVKSLLVLIGVDQAELEAGLGKVKAKLEAHEKEFRKIGLAMTAIGGTMTAFFAKSINEAAKSEAAQAKVHAALSNVEGASKGAAAMLIKYAGALQQTTGIEDEEIMNAQALLATFGLNEKQIAALTPRILDMAVAHSRATGEQIDLNGATMALGRAVTGHMELLGRQGVVLSEQTKKTGDFNLMIKDLDKSFGGAAVAAGQTFAGQMRILKANIGETFEAIGARLLPVLLPLVTRIGDVVKRGLDWIDAHQGLMKTLVPILAGLGALLTILGPMVMIFPKIASGVMMVGKSFLFLAANPIVLVLAGLSTLAIVIYKVVDAMNTAKGAQGVFNEANKESVAIMMEAAQKAGFTAEEFGNLEKKYKGNAVIMKEAILQAKEGVHLQQSLQLALIAHGKAVELEGKAYDKTNKEIEEYIKKLRETGTTLPEISKIITEIPSQWDKWNNIIGIFEAIRNAGSVTFSYLGEISKSTVLKLVDDIEWGKEWLKSRTKETVTDLKEAQEEITTIGLQLFGDFMSRTLEGFMVWGEGHKNILRSMGDAFSGFIRNAITGIGQLMTATLMASAKEILAKKAEAVAHAIASVMKSIPFPLNLALVGVAIAAVTALFSKIRAFGEGGIVMKPTLALIGERGPEAVMPIGRFGMAAAGVGGMTVQVRQSNFFYGDIKTDYDIDEISEKLAQKTQDAIKRGRR